jgi:hypothetical protein
MKSRLPSPALVVAVIALVVATTGAAIALPGKNKVKSDDIAKNAIKSKQIKKGQVKTSDLANNAVKAANIAAGAVTGEKLAGDSVDGTKVANESLNADDIGDYDTFNELVTATAGVDFATARAAAPEIPLATFGTLTVYGKCLVDSTNTDIRGEIYVETSANGAIVQGTDNLPANNDQLLTTATAETDREVDDQDESNANAGSIGESEAVLITAEGRYAHLLTSIAVKQGTFPGGNGAFGAGDVCFLSGVLNG